MRRRLGVALLLPEPWSSEINGLRRALGAPSLDAQPPHLTLVPPVNVPEGRVDDAVAVLRRAAARCVSSIQLTVGPPATFAPISPVIYLEVVRGGDEVAALQANVFAGPLLRRVDYDYVPHVTVCESASDEAVRLAPGLLRHFRVDVTVDRVHLLAQGADRVWRSLTDVAFGPPVVRGRGGVELHLRWTHRPAPDVHALMDLNLRWTPEPQLDRVKRPDQFLEARDARDALIGVRSGSTAVVVDDWLGCGIEDRLHAEPSPT